MFSHSEKYKQITFAVKPICMLLIRSLRLIFLNIIILFIAKLSSFCICSERLGVPSTHQVDNFHRSYGIYHRTGKLGLAIFCLFPSNYSVYILMFVCFSSTWILLSRTHNILWKETCCMPWRGFWSFQFQTYMCGSACSTVFFTCGMSTRLASTGPCFLPPLPLPCVCVCGVC